MFSCALILLVVLGYPALQAYALFKLRETLRLFAWFVLILAVPFCLLCIGSVLLDQEMGGMPGKGIIQSLLVIIACTFANLILLLLLFFQAVTSSKTPPPI